MNISQNTIEILKPVVNTKSFSFELANRMELLLYVHSTWYWCPTGHPYWKKNYSGPLIFTFTKAKSRYIINLNVEGKIIKVLEDNAK